MWHIDLAKRLRRTDWRTNLSNWRTKPTWTNCISYETYNDINYSTSHLLCKIKFHLQKYLFSCQLIALSSSLRLEKATHFRHYTQSLSLSFYCLSQVEVTVVPDSLWVTVSINWPPTTLAVPAAHPDTAARSSPFWSPVTLALIL